MKQKIIPLLFAIILCISLASAETLSVSTSTPNSLTKYSKSTTFSITNSGSAVANIAVILPSHITDSKGNSIIISTSSQLSYNNVVPNQNIIINISYSGDTTNFIIGEASSTIAINAYDSTNSSNSLSQTVPLNFINDFCKYGENSTSNISISNVDINNEDGDDTEWSPINHITVKFDVNNDGDNKLSSVVAEIGIIDSKGKNIINNFDDLSDKKQDLGTISDGKSKRATYTFTVPDDFSEESYILVIKAYKDGKESLICVSSSGDLDNNYYQTIEGVRETDEDKQVVVTNIKSSPEDSANCGERVQVSADIANIGDQDYEDQVKVTLYNKELGIDLEQIIRGDLDQGDSEGVDFTFDIPANATEKTYNIEFKTYYDYNGDDTYSRESEETFTQTLKVEGNCKPSQQSSTPKAQISADLDPETPEAIAGKQVMIDVTIKNLADTQMPYTISVYGNSAWSSLVSIQPETITLNPQESRTVTIVLNVDSAATGDKDFTIRATSGTTSTEQRVALPITKTQMQFNSIFTSIGKNWFIYLIILVNVVLIVAIIIVIKRMVAPKRRKEFE